MIRRFLSSAAIAVLAHTATGRDIDPKVEFNRDVRPILSDKCFFCHGPDEKKRKSGLRLDLRDGAIKPAKSGDPAIVPGKPDESELVRRIFSDDKEEVMNTGAIVTGRPSFGSWMLYGLGAETEELPGFIVLTSTSKGIGGAQPISARQWSAGILPSKFQGIMTRMPPETGKSDPDTTIPHSDGLPSGSTQMTGPPLIPPSIRKSSASTRWAPAP